MSRAPMALRRVPRRIQISLLVFIVLSLMFGAYLYDADVRFLGAYYLHLPTSYIVRSSSLVTEKFTYSGLNDKKITFEIPRAYLPLLSDQHAEIFKQSRFSSIEVVGNVTQKDISLLPYSFGIRHRFDGPNAEEIGIEVRDLPLLLRNSDRAEYLLQRDLLAKIDGMPRRLVRADSSVFEISGISDALNETTSGAPQERARWFVVNPDSAEAWVVVCHATTFSHANYSSRWRCGGRFIESDGLEVILTFPVSQIAEAGRLKDAVAALLNSFKASS